MGCIVISYIICHRWFGIMKDQSEKIVGASAPEAFLTSLRDLIRQHNPLILDADRVIAFYSGSRYNVEAFLVLRQTATVDVAYDLALSVQNMLEDLEDVQRANVHVSQYCMLRNRKPKQMCIPVYHALYINKIY